MCARTGSEPTSSALFAERPTTLAYDARAVQATMQRWHARGLALTVAFCSTVTCNTSPEPVHLTIPGVASPSTEGWVSLH
jgi:hypothetical protein